MRRSLPAVILDAAADTFAHVGFSAATMDEIALRAHTTKSMLYYHFRSKSELYRRLLEAALGRLTADMEEAGDALDAATAFLDHVAREPHAGFLLRAFFATDADLARDEMASCLGRVLAPIARRLEGEGAQERAFAVLSLMVMPLLRGLLLDEQVDAASIRRQVARYLAGASGDAT